MKMWKLTTLLFFLATASMMTTATISTVEYHERYPDRCLKDVKEVTPRKFFQLDNDIHNITIEASSQVGHQLVTAAFSIFLQEVLGYDSVTVKTYKDNFNVSVILRRLADSGFDGPSGPDELRVPETMVNLAVWIPHDVELADWTSPERLENCGHLGFSGRFGWFIPKNPIVKSQPVDYWRTFQNNPELASIFSLEGKALAIAMQYSKNSTSGRYFCEESFCEKGAFEPVKCQAVKKRHNKSHSCAILLASYPASEIQSSHFLPEQIKALDLHIKILYVGPNLETVVHQLTHMFANSTAQAVMFFGWKPSLVTAGLNLASVSFPACNSDVFCHYESRKLKKIVWSKFREGAKAAYEAVHRISFSTEQYLTLLNLYKTVRLENEEATVQEIACRWMNMDSSRRIWNDWKNPSATDQKTPLYIGGIFPITGTYTARGILIAAEMATKAINENNKVLKDYILKLFVHDGQCRADMVMKSFIDYIRLPTFPHMAGILGPACSDTVEPLAGVARHFKTVVISYSAEGSTFSDREKYPYFFRTIGENKQYQYVYLQLFQQLKWARIASLTEEGQKYAEYVSHLHDLLQEKNIAFVANRKFPRDRTAVSMSQYLQDLKAKKAKIIIGDFYDQAARAVMCEAYKQKMTAREGYVWFLPTWFIPRWYDTDSYNLISGKDPVPCNTSEMIQAINGHLSLQYAYYAPDEDVIPENITVSEWRNQYETACHAKNTTISDYGGYAYDAVWTYAFAIEKLLKQNHSHIANLHSDKTTNTFVQMLNQTDFHGVSGHIKFVGGPSRVSKIHVVQWMDKQKIIVGSFFPQTSNTSNEIIGGRLELNPADITWLTPDRQQPKDGSEPPPKCVLETLASTLDVTCEVAIVIANVIGFGILGLVLVMCFVVIKRRYDRRVQITEDYFKALGIDLLSATSVSALDKWEIPRDRVVINRKLGEGAFGTVYGGETFFDDKGWVAVAVKTLKVGSTCEQKLDFLSEAEVMKRFEHKNIIKLLGVCTKNEPVYTIMEFMLYGDLKTYLLGRRHLVNERNCEESDEISNKRLTSMTLDVARALSYLAELKYVHRDVACRNCLVNLSRVVKLGDFGMTRAIYENDYYRFQRKGMLPVRWMSPESLALGIFTPMSDVWSFGVLLYEIITFGSFPFQGLSNNQVLEQVKAGATISIPSGVKPQLEGLLKSCWALDAGRRPAASEIVEFLANNPRIIQPYLDIPLASVQLEGTDQLEMQPPFRKSVKSVVKNRTIRTVSTDKDKDCPEVIPLSLEMNGHSQHHNSQNNYQSPYATLQHESDLI